MLRLAAGMLGLALVGSVGVGAMASSPGEEVAIDGDAASDSATPAKAAPEAPAAQPALAAPQPDGPLRNSGVDPLHRSGEGQAWGHY